MVPNGAYLKSLERLFNAGSHPKLGLSRMNALLERLGNPHLAMRSLHVAGTNGKGSVCAMLDAMLAAGGVRRGLYTSPHLASARERISVDGQMISEVAFASLEQQVFEATHGLEEMPTFFERMTAMAFLAFANAGVDVAVLEVGLGGRLDATNVVTPLACGITRIDLDHQNVLGNSVEAIAREKAGIIKSGVPVVASAQLASVSEVLSDCAARHNAPLYQVGEHLQIERSPAGIGVYWGAKEIMLPAHPALRGAHQYGNIAVAVGMLERAGLVDDVEARKLGVECTRWPGRFEVFGRAGSTPYVVLDGAHNPCGTQSLVDSLAADGEFAGRACHLVFGVTKGHDALPILEILRQSLKPVTITLTQSRSPRSLDAVVLGDIATEAGFVDVNIERDVRLALAKVSTQAATAYLGRDDFVLVTGSLYLVGQVRAMLSDMPEDPEFPLY